MPRANINEMHFLVGNRNTEQTKRFQPHLQKALLRDSGGQWCHSQQLGKFYH